MPKLLEKNGAEMMASLVNIAAPIRRFMEDDKFSEAFTAATRDGVKLKKTDLLDIYVDLVPLMFGEEHLKDTLTILAEVEGKTAKEMLEMNGTDLLADALAAWKDQIVPFFLRLGLSVGKKPSA